MIVEARGFAFDVHAGGPAGGPPVLLLHGFPQDARAWDRVRPSLHAAGLRTYAVDQRGYSPGARPRDVQAYRLDETVADAAALLDALELSSAHVVGHDWGATVGWRLAAAHPDRVRSLVALSVPHPRAIADALRGLSQPLRLAYFPLFRTPGLAERLLAGGALRAMLAPVGPELTEAYVTAMAEPGRLTAALNWYRANSLRDAVVDAVQVPTTFVYATGDAAVSPRAVLACARWVDADYRLVVLPKISHWIPEQAPEAVSDVIRARIIDNV